MTKHRCKFCHKLLFKYQHVSSEAQVDIEIKCPKCGKMNEFRIIKMFVKAIAHSENFRFVVGRAE